MQAAHLKSPKNKAPPPNGEGANLKTGCKKFHGHYSAANFSTPEFESHAKKSITAQRIVGDAETAGDEAGHSRNVASDRSVAEGHETQADA